MSADLEEGRALARARAGDEQAFRGLVERYRPELQAHCYRMLGSAQDAEDMVQEALLSAWRALDGFQSRSSFRAWLYKIATNACLSVLRRERRRREIAPPPEPPGQPPAPSRTFEPVWLEPYPDSLFEDVPDTAPGPDARYGTRESIQLAFVAALQTLPPGQRAALVLRDVLGFRTAETAAILGSTEDSVDSALRRARTRIDDARGPETVSLPGSPAERKLVGRFADAFESGDVSAVVALLSEDARLTMPPEPFEYQGRLAIAGFLSTVPAAGALERFHLVPTRANGQPAFGCYLRDPHGGPARAYGLMVLTVGPDAVTAITGFPDTSVFRCFGLPRALPV